MQNSLRLNSLSSVATRLGGATLFLLGNLAFKTVLWGREPLSHLVGFGLLGIAGFFATGMTPFALAAAIVAILVGVAASETLSLRHAATPRTPGGPAAHHP